MRIKLEKGNYRTKSYSMFKLTPFLFFIFFSCLVHNPNQTYAQQHLDSVFINWNISTFKSLDAQIQSSTDSVQKSNYENRRLTFNGYLDIEKVESVNTESLRYKFLRKIRLRNNERQNFYIIEANKSGMSMLLRNFVVQIGAAHKAEIVFFTYVNGKWQKQGLCKKDNFNIDNDLKSSITEFGNGFNYGDIIVTKFENNLVKESQYYLYSTLSMKSGIKEVLNCYKQENFIK